MTDSQTDNRECGWFGCHRPECEQFCAGIAPDCLHCGFRTDRHNPSCCHTDGCALCEGGGSDA